MMVKRRRRRRNRTKRGRESKRRECLRIQNVLFEEMEEVEGDRTRRAKDLVPGTRTLTISQTDMLLFVIVGGLVFEAVRLVFGFFA